MPIALPSLWDDTTAATLSEPEQLQYRSNLLGSDLRITNYGGGNTSAKVTDTDPLTGEPCEVLWVKGSGGDLGSITLDGFSTLYQRKLEQLKSLYRGIEFEDDMVGYLPHCTFNLNPRAASIDTPLHAFVPYRHVDHMHPDAVIAIACADNSRELTELIFDGELGWLPWKRPGFELGLQLEALCRERPDIRGIVLQGHGLFTWGDDAKSCYENTIKVINQTARWLHDNRQGDPFNGVATTALSAAQRHDVAAALMPRIRGQIMDQQRQVGHFNDADTVLEFVNSVDLAHLAALGTSCPDHFLRTKIRPLVLNFNPQCDDLNLAIKQCSDALEAQIADYRADYTAYYERCRDADSPALRDPNAIVYLIPGVGMITFARDKATARIAGEFYVNAINVMRDANSVGQYVGLSEQEAFNIEYWALEEAKLQRMPKPKPLAGRVAFITGGAGGIGKATAVRLLSEGACVMLADIDAAALEAATDELSRAFSADVVATCLCDVTDENSVIAAMRATAVAFGGLDILVSNAGIASSAPLEDTSLDLWNRNISILATGYFIVSREGFKLLKTQKAGGAIVFIASKNGLVASANASAYCTAKAAEIQLARSVALEGAELGIRCNVVNPDAVLRGSKIWTGQWRQERAAAYNMAEDELEAHYRSRSMLKLNVFPEDIAEAVYFLASDQSSKSTGNIINVDAGHAPSFTR